MQSIGEFSINFFNKRHKQNPCIRHMYASMYSSMYASIKYFPNIVCMMLFCLSNFHIVDGFRNIQP